MLTGWLAVVQKTSLWTEAIVVLNWPNHATKNMGGQRAREENNILIALVEMQSKKECKRKNEK